MLPTFEYNYLIRGADLVEEAALSLRESHALPDGSFDDGYSVLEFEGEMEIAKQLREIAKKHFLK